MAAGTKTDYAVVRDESGWPGRSIMRSFVKQPYRRRASELPAWGGKRTQDTGALNGRLAPWLVASADGPTSSERTNYRMHRLVGLVTAMPCSRFNPSIGRTHPACCRPTYYTVVSPIDDPLPGWFICQDAVQSLQPSTSTQKCSAASANIVGWSFVSHNSLPANLTPNLQQKDSKCQPWTQKFRVWAGSRLETATPIRFPYSSNTGPPLFPGWIAAEI